MTIADLIKKLETLPQDAEIVYYYEDGFRQNWIEFNYSEKDNECVVDVM